MGNDMDKKAINKIQSRLRVAKSALIDLEGCDSYTSFVDKWYVFLVAAKNIYTVLEQGAKTTPASDRWFQAKKRERISDPLLRYVYEARNDDEHGLEAGTEEIPESLSIGGWEEGHSSNFQISGGPSQGFRLTSFDGKPVKVEHTPHHVQLKTVHNRNGVAVPPPQEHLGRPLADRLPLAVARLAVARLEVIVAEAEALA